MTKAELWRAEAILQGGRDSVNTSAQCSLTGLSQNLARGDNFMNSRDYSPCSIKAHCTVSLSGECWKPNEGIDHVLVHSSDCR